MAGQTGAIVAVGDCNTLGVGPCLGASYPERVARLLGMPVTNRGYTMSTSREGRYLLADALSGEHSLVMIQFGLVDAYLTLACAPYVLYFPDNVFRKQARSILKKFKKISRKSGLNRLLGERCVVPLAEYEANISSMVASCTGRRIILPETIPHHDSSRNGLIEQYNRVLAQIASRNPQCILIETYADFAANQHSLYADATHANALGYELIADKIVTALGR